MATQKPRVHCFGISLDGYSAGANQSLDHPLGVGGTGLMEWFFSCWWRITRIKQQSGFGISLDSASAINKN
jgi:hypothetical protein